jgi:endo-1,4-beta-xylanase
VTYTNEAAGRYTVQWNNVQDFTSGKGWQNASARTIAYSGTFNPGSNSYLAVYTWSQQGETYILENFGQYNPGAAGQHIGTLTSDGGTYDVYHVSRSATYQQFWSIRQQKRSSGTVTTANHYSYYNAHNLKFDPATNATYQIVSTEGYGSTGSADITVSEVTS